MILITPALEDYLETILLIQQKNNVVRVKDLVDALEVKASSVNEAIAQLKDKNLILHERYSYITLTEKGLEIAQDVYQRHQILKKFFNVILGVKESVAEEDACKIEHYLSKETVSCLLKYIKAKGLEL